MDDECTHVSPGCPSDGSSLGYAPNLPVTIVFLILFGIALLCNIIQGSKYKTWTFMAMMCLGSQSEVIGYIGRIFMHYNPYRFLVQIICLTSGPAFYSAALYLCLSRIIIVYGENLSRISAKMYTRFFIFCDLISLSLQGGGGGVAASATKPGTLSIGNKLMLAGLIFQIVSLGFFAAACADFAIRVKKYPNRKNPRFSKTRMSTGFRAFLLAVALVFMAIFIRCIYRVVELGSGWDSALMRKEVPFIILESGMITIAVFCFVVVHPGFAFGDDFNTIQYMVLTKGGGEEAGFRRENRSTIELAWGQDHENTVGDSMI
ncbi:uncharacterized protein A1O5_10987 [Cladophialophora psammophila CBS 110553]|uniref:Uncharacterized protein n=1 Tax=Cladophialophora psammophila CBS 110553 TaxID=1182543 RepID=W9WLY1_9EURO|nr:uncharacterized protein A1O5_10987 [Cladophialophora psammophila CBS 110553]EXJ66010.1 hypothetical protein A1O5_10987 [Cladophialophora psammophila CBS 110553]